MRVVRVIIWGIVVLAAWYLWVHARPDWPEELRISLAVVLLVCGVLWLGRERGAPRTGWRVMGEGNRPVGKALLWSLVVGLLGIGLVLWLRSPAERMVQVWHESFPSTTVRKPPAANGGQRVSGNGLWSDGTRRSLPRRTNLKPGRKPELFLRLDDSHLNEEAARRPMYVSAVRFDRYRNSAWEIDRVGGDPLVAGPDGQIQLDDRDPEGGIWHTVVLSPSPSGQRSPLAGLQGISRVEGTGMLEPWSDGMRLLPGPAKPGTGYRYRALSHPMRLSDVAQAARGTVRGELRSSWLALPDDGPLLRGITAMTKKVVTAGDEVSRCRQIETYLRDHYRYSLSTKNPDNLDPLENFLFGEKAGHCEFFATAGALMARASGVPARVVYGWAGGTWFSYADWFIFRADEAHAWVEVWLEGYGWVVMDPTPEQALRSFGRRSADEAVPGMPETQDGWPEWQETGALAHAGEVPWAWGSALAAVAGVVCLLRGRRPTVMEVSRDASRPWRQSRSSRYHELWKSCCRKHCPGLDLHATTLRQQLAVWQPEPEFARDLGDYHYGVQYRGQPRSRARERQLAARIRVWDSVFRAKP